MLIFLYGPDSYRRQQKLKALVSEYQKKHSVFTIEHFSLDEENDFERLKNFAGNVSLFDKSKLAVVHNAEEVGKEAAEFLKQFIDDKNTTLIITADDKLRRPLTSPGGVGAPTRGASGPTKDFQFLLKKPVLAQEFEELKGTELINFIKKEAEARNIKLPTSNLQLLTSLYVGDTWGLINELEKIALGGKPEAEVQIPEFFASIQRLKRGPLGLRLSALAYLLEEEDPAKIFNITAAVADPELKVKMADYDVAVKSGKLEYEEVLLDLVLS